MPFFGYILIHVADLRQKQLLVTFLDQLLAQLQLLRIYIVHLIRMIENPLVLEGFSIRAGAEARGATI